MDLSLSADLVRSRGGQFEWLDEADSTNSLLMQQVGAPHFSVIATDNQISGRGRAGRVWQAPAGTSLAVSVLLRPKTSANLNQLGWLPLLAGLAMARTVSKRLTVQVGVKWPNDVLVGERKISGVLSELLPDLKGVVIGAGVNLWLERDQLPVETATSLRLEGAGDFTVDQVLSDYLAELDTLYRDFEAFDFDADLSGLRTEVSKACLTLGRNVKAVLPGSSEELGTAIELDETGRLVIQQGSKSFAVAAGDIIHMRHN